MNALCSTSPTGTAARKLPRKNEKVSPALHYGVCLARKNQSTAFVCFALHMLCVPLILLSLIVRIGNSMKKAEYGEPGKIFEFWGINDIYVMIGCAALLIAVLLGSNIAMNSFSHLYNKQKADMELSLPLSAEERFTAGFFSGLTVYILPFIAAQVFSLILFLIGHLTVDGREVSYAFIGAGVTEGTRICTVFEDIFPAYIRLAAGGIIIMTMFYTLWVLTMTLCGSKSETAVYGAAANLIMPALYYTFNTLMKNKMYGTISEINGSPLLNSVFYATSPIGAGVSLAACAGKRLFGLTYWYEDIDNITFGKFAIPVLVCTSVFFCLAMRLYVRRRAEDVGKSFVGRKFYYTLITCALFCTLIIMNLPKKDEINLEYNDSVLVPSIALSAAVYLILDCVHEKGINLKSIGISLLRYAATAAGTLAVFLLTVNTGFFGAEEYVPDISDIKTVTLLQYGGYGGYYNIVTPYIEGFEQPAVFYAPNDDGDVYSGYTFSGNEAKSIITEVHSRQLELHKTSPYSFDYGFLSNSDLHTMEQGSEYYCPDTVYIKYDLKNGNSVLREYIMHAGAYSKLLALETSEERRDILIDTAEKFAECMKGISEFYLIVGDRNISTAENKTEFIDGITAAYISDVRNMTEEALVRSDRDTDSPYSAVYFYPVSALYPEYSGTHGFLNIPHCFTETRKYLDSLKYDEDTVYTDEERKADKKEYFYSSDIAVCKTDPAYDLPVTMTKNDPLLYISAPKVDDYSGEQAIPAIYEDAPVKVSSDKIDEEDMSALFEIYSNSTSSYIPDKECYTMTTDANLAGFRYIPERYYDTLEEILAKYAG